jgi:hypothetical protein
MVRLCSKSSCPYSGRPVARAHRQRWGQWPEMVAVREQESAEAVVPRVTSRITPDGLTNREGPNLAGRTRPSVVLTRSDEADWLSFRAAIIVAEKDCCPVRKDCQEPPYADPHVRWCGSREGKPSRRPDWAACSSLWYFRFERCRHKGECLKITTSGSLGRSANESFSWCEAK